MGLLDSVLGGVLGQLGGAQKGDGQGQGAGGLDPKIMMALGLLAMMAMRHKGGGDPNAVDAGAAGAPGGLGGLGGGLGGVLGGMLGGGSAPAPGGLDLGSLLGGLLGGQGEAAGSAQAMGAAAGGIGALRNVLAQAGLGQQVDSWIGTGSNEDISPTDLSNALGDSGALQSLAETTGMSHEDVAASLSAGLPELIDRLTPDGRVPDA